MKENNIKPSHTIEIHKFRYGSDASMSAASGHEPNFACIGMGVDATHHYERTHMDGVEACGRLIIEYAKN